MFACFSNYWRMEKKRTKEKNSIIGEWVPSAPSKEIPTIEEILSFYNLDDVDHPKKKDREGQEGQELERPYAWSMTVSSLGMRFIEQIGYL